MAILKAKEIRQLTHKLRIERITELSKELMKLRSHKASGAAAENPGKIKEIKRTIARILTINRQSPEKGGTSKKP